MAIISDSTKIDKSFKFVSGKGYTTTQKGIDNEDASSGFIVGTSSIFSQSIPNSAPGASTSILTFYGDGTNITYPRFKMIYDVSSPLNKAWYASTDGTNLTTMRNTRISNWVPPSFGNYTIRIFLTHGSSTTATPVLEIFFSDQTAPLFDYKTGILTFETDPLSTYSSLVPTPDGIQISGYVYAGTLLNQSFDAYGNVQSSLTSFALKDSNVALAEFNTNGPLIVSSADAYGPSWIGENITIPFNNSGGFTWTGTWQTPNGMSLMTGTDGFSFKIARSYADGYWHATQITSTGTPTAVWGADNSNIFVTSTSASHVVLRSTDGGVSFHDITGAALSDAYAIWGSSLNDIYIFGSDGYIAHSIDTGINFHRAGVWTNFTSAFSSNFPFPAQSVILSDGRIFMLVSGSSQAQIFDPVNDAVVNAAAIPLTVHRPCIALLPGNKVGVFGGASAESGPGSIYGTIQIYNVSGNSWATSIATLGNPRFNAAAIPLTVGPNAGKILIAGGETDAVQGVNGGYDIYDPVGDTITSYGTGPFRSQYRLVALQNGTILLNGGQISDILQTDLNLYDPVANSWSLWPSSLGAGRVDHSCVLLSNNKVLIAGGNGNTPSSPNVISSYYLYNSDGTLNSNGNMVTARRLFGMATIGDGTSVIVAGGLDGSASSISAAEIYVFGSTFVSTTNMNQAVSNNVFVPITSGAHAGDIATISDTGQLAERYTSGQINADTHNLNGAWGSSSSNIYAVGDSGTIVYSSGSGSWVTQTSGIANKLRGIFGNSSSDIFAVGDSGTILHSTGNGIWSSQSIASTISLYGVWSTTSGGNRYYVVGYDSSTNNGVIYVSNGNGTWTSVNSRLHSTFQSIFGGLAGVYVSDTNTTDGESPQRLPANQVLETTGKLYVDTNLTAGASITTQAAYVKNNIIISDAYGFLSTAHIISQGNVPQIVTGSAAGSGGSLAVSIAGTDVAGEIILTTGNGTVGGAAIFTVSYGTVYPSDINTYVMITPSNDAAGHFVLTSWTYVTSSFQSFSLNVGSGATALSLNTQYKWQYHVIGVGQV